MGMTTKRTICPICEANSKLVKSAKYLPEKDKANKWTLALWISTSVCSVLRGKRCLRHLDGNLARKWRAVGSISAWHTFTVGLKFSYIGIFSWTYIWMHIQALFRFNWIKFPDHTNLQMTGIGRNAIASHWDISHDGLPKLNRIETSAGILSKPSQSCLSMYYRTFPRSRAFRSSLFFPEGRASLEQCDCPPAPTCPTYIALSMRLYGTCHDCL